MEKQWIDKTMASFMDGYKFCKIYNRSCLECFIKFLFE